MTRGPRQIGIGKRVRPGVAVSLALAFIGFAPGAGSVPTEAQTPSPTLPDIIFVQAAKISEEGTSSRFPDGSRLVRLAAGNRSNHPVSLTDGLFAVADPQVSFDGLNVLFAAQKNSGETWQIWEMKVDGAAKHQLTNCVTDCTWPAYLPAEEIAFTVAGSPSTHESSYLSVAKSDGSQVRRITFGPGDWRLETVLRDGRIVASASWPLTEASSSQRNRLLYTLRPDGSALDALRCDHQDPAVRAEASELEDGSIVFVKTAHPGQTGGSLAEIEKGEVHEHLLGLPSEQIASVQELTAGRLIVSRKQSFPANHDGKLGLYVVNLKSKTIGERIYSDAHLNSLKPVPVMARAAPKKFWSTLNPQLKSGYFISLNSYSSADEASGKIATPIASVRVWTLLPASLKEELLGEAPVEKDGSFYLKVKADQPVRFELLDASGKTIRAEHSWIWSRPGEQRGCAGCHSDRAVAPENRWPMTLKRFDTPTPLGGDRSASREAHEN